MKVKYVDIARALGISKATVSLAMNGKPGVNEKTRQEILDYKHRLETGEVLTQTDADPLQPVNYAGKQIKVVQMTHGLKNVVGAEMDLWTDVKIVYQKYAKTRGISLGILYYDIQNDDPRMLEECNDPDVVGVILIGTELQSRDFELLGRIRKPLVITDCDPEMTRHPSVMFDNRIGIEQAVDYLVSRGHRNIVYLGISISMYNYSSRRRGFRESMEKRGLAWDGDHMVSTGETIEEIYYFMKDYLERNPLPDAFLMDTYHVSIGAIRALREKGIAFPEEVSLVGVDMLPPYLTGDKKMTTVRVPHTERAYWAMQMLFKEMDAPSEAKARMYLNCPLVEGETVRESVCNRSDRP